MGAFRFFAVLLSFLVLTALAPIAIAQTAPPVVTVNPGGTTSGTGSAVCDPNIRSMLDAAGSAQARRDIQTISSVIGRPPNAMEINCYTQVRDRLMSSTGGGAATPCPAMDQAWTEAINNANNAAGGGTSGTPTAATFDRINLYAGATEPVSQVANNECHPGIPTGVRINGVAEVVCPNPGCAPKRDGNSYKCERY